MSPQTPGNGSLKIEKAWWNYAELELHSGRPISTLQKYVHWRVLRRGKEYLKFGSAVQFHPKKAMERLNYIGANPDVLRQAKKVMAHHAAQRKQAANG